MKLYPLKFKPIYKEKVWGGAMLGEMPGRRLPGGARIGESWEISEHGADVSVVEGGALDGVGLRELVRMDPEGILGKIAVKKFGVRFPLLVKIIDAAAPLSVQVHPGDDYAASHENGEPGKTEFWYVLGAERGAEIICGFEGRVEPGEFRKSLAGPGPPRGLRRIPVKEGDALFVRPGSVHSIGAGALILEISTASDITYRLHDWRRAGRPLHTEKALQVTDFSDSYVRLIERKWEEMDGCRAAVLTECPYFKIVEMIVGGGGACVLRGRGFSIVSVLRGEGKIVFGEAGDTAGFHKGDNLLLPASLGPCRVDAGKGGCGIAHTEVP